MSISDVRVSNLQDALLKNALAVLRSERPKLYRSLAVLSAIGLDVCMMVKIGRKMLILSRVL